MNALPAALAASAALALAPRLDAPQAPPAGGPRVRLGIDVLLASRAELVAGKRLGLITNPSGVDASLVPTADRLARDPRVKLVQLFAPEHGIRGAVKAGDDVADGVDPVTGLPVESLYGSTKRPSPAALKKIDVLLFDIQDIGSRTYTYASTMAEALIAAAEAKKPMIVLDRPNPLGGELVEGPIREEQWKSFISWGPIPIVHGMTVGELARFYNAELKLSGLASGKKTTTDLTYGIGGQYDFNRNLGLRLEWNRYSGVKAPDVAGRSSSDTDIDVLSVGALWRF